MSVELDDPFGDDPNDIDVNGMVDAVSAPLASAPALSRDEAQARIALSLSLSPRSLEVLADLRVVLDEIDGDGAADKARVPAPESLVLLPAPATESTGLVPRS